MKRQTLLLAAALTALLSYISLPTAVVMAQDAYSAALGRLISGTPVKTGVGADDLDTALLVRHVGSAASGLVAVSAIGDLTFTVGPLGSEVADTTFECPVAAPLGGVIDVSDAACDTFGEVVDSINSSANWAAVIHGGLRTDSSNDTLLTISATSASVANGLALKWDTDVAFKSTLVVAESDTIQFYTSGSTIRANPFAGRQSIVFLTNATSTYASGTSNYEITCLTVNNARTGATETNITTYRQPGGATTANKVFDFSPYGLFCARDQKMLARLVNSAAMASTVNYVAGHRFAY